MLSSHPKENEGDNNNKPNRNHGTKPLIKQFTSNTKKRERDYMLTKRNKRSMTVIPRFLTAWSTSHAFCYSKTGKTPAPFLSLFSDPPSPPFLSLLSVLSFQKKPPLPLSSSFSFLFLSSLSFLHSSVRVFLSKPACLQNCHICRP